MRPPALFLLSPNALDMLYGPGERADLDTLLDFVAPPQSAESVAALGKRGENVEVIVSGWGMAKMTPSFLAAFPNLKIIFYAAGSVRAFVTDESWEKGVRVVSAWRVNAVPVAEYTFAQIILCLKQVWAHAQAARRTRSFARLPNEMAGAYGSTVGLISLGEIGQHVARRLQTLDVKVIAYDPFFPEEKAAALGVELVSLEDVFAQADVVSCHLPLQPSTTGLLRAGHFTAMRPGASFINTARGAVVREEEMIAVLQSRPDLFAVLDVTHPEPPVAGSPLYDLPNVLLTPHVAGSVNNECRRMGRHMVNQTKRYLNGHTLEGEISRELVARMA
jgi:phosphoglycerate dehydrogenase-like enzyme